MATETWLQYMTRRGWTTKVIQRYAIGGETYDNRPCLRFVTVNTEGEKAFRVKFVDGKEPKIKWAGKTEQANFKYYSAGKLTKAIADASGTLYWLSGEPDIWTLYEACNVDWSTACFGEKSIPETVVEDLTAMGVTQVVMYPDLDKTGMEAAAKLYRLLKDSEIALVIRRIPGDMDSKRDLNQLWQDVSFNAHAFNEALKKCTRLTETDLAQYLPEEKPVTSQPKQTSLDLDFAAMFDEWIEDVIRSLGQCDVREGRVQRWHCPLPNHDDKHPSFRIGDGSKVKNPICTCGVQSLGTEEGWNAVARAKGMPTWDDYKKHRIADAGHVKIAKANPPQAPATNGAAPKVDHTPDEPLYLDSHSIYKQILDHLEGENIPDIEFIECPMECLHEFGGFAEIMFPVKLVYIAGISGGGKTSFAETMAEKMQRQGYDFVWYGPEWTPYEMGLRSLQRAQGADMIHMAKNFQYQVQGKRGVPAEQRKGIPLNNEQVVISNRKILDMAGWHGRGYFLTPKANKLSLSDMLNTVRAIVTAKRSEGRKVVAFYFDYLQRANKGGRNQAFWSEEVIGEIKSLCEELQLIGFVMVQPKKSDSQDARDGDTLSEASGQGLSDQQCNLYLTLTPRFDGDHKTDYSTLKVVKNSMGQTGEIVIRNDWQHLLVIDKKQKVISVGMEATGR